MRQAILTPRSLIIIICLCSDKCYWNPRFSGHRWHIKTCYCPLTDICIRGRRMCKAGKSSKTIYLQGTLTSLVTEKLTEYCIHFTCSPDPEQQAHTDVLWDWSLYRASVVQVKALTALFPLLANYNFTMLHLWVFEDATPRPLSCTVISWAGLSLRNSSK